MKIKFSVVMSLPGTVGEVLQKIKEVTGKESTKEQAEEHFYMGMRDFIERETDDDMMIETITCNFTEDDISDAEEETLP